MLLTSNAELFHGCVYRNAYVTQAVEALAGYINGRFLGSASVEPSTGLKTRT